MTPSEPEPVGAAFARLMRALCPLLTESWVETELTMAQLKALALLHARGRASGREVAQAMSIGPSAVSQLVDRLVGEGYVRREEDPHDRRVTWLVPTPRGRAAVEQLVVARRERFAAVVAALDTAPLSRAQVAAALEALAAAAERTAEPLPAAAV
ncbi:MAG TPA: MarR family transcriptional regulator [Chloroflexota bacterium]|nr:MarR family transcriptional regulator [Chloroflexota bacterium]